MISQQELQQKIIRGWTVVGLALGILFLISVVWQILDYLLTPNVTVVSAITCLAIGVLVMAGVLGVGNALVKQINADR